MLKFSPDQDRRRRQTILGACKQHKVDTDSYNDNNSFNTTLPLFDYDFNRDLEELALPAEYPDPDPDPDADDSDDDTPETVH